MDFCLNYIDQMDSRLKRIARLLDGNNRDALRKALDPAAFARENLELFYNNFDITFLITPRKCKTLGEDLTF